LDLATTSTPLASAGRVLFGEAGAAIMAIGAMISVSGSDESDMLGSSRLAYAMAADGMLPKPLAAVHRRFATPYVALIAQGVIAGALTFVDKIPDLISFAVVNLAFSFLLCAASLVRLQAGSGRQHSLVLKALPYAAAIIAVLLLVQTSSGNKMAGGAVLAAGCVVYLFTAPGRRLLPHELHLLWDHEWFLAHRRMRFLGGLMGLLGGRRSTTARPPIAGGPHREHRVD
jgi:amino acid transporter